jgi:hypothetical protein
MNDMAASLPPFASRSLLYSLPTMNKVSTEARVRRRVHPFRLTWIFEKPKWARVNAPQSSGPTLTVWIAL